MEFVKEFKKHPITFVLVGINVVVFLVNGILQDALRSNGVLTVYHVLLEKEYWRIVTACFLHGNFMHLFNNMVTLLFLGMFLEERVGKQPVLWAYLCAGIGGNIVSLIYKIGNGIGAGSLGASGAIFGLDGLLLAKVLLGDRGVRQIPLPRVLFMVFLSVYSGFSSPGIDNAAHIGGLLFGFLVGVGNHFWLVYRQRRH